MFLFSINFSLMRVGRSSHNIKKKKSSQREREFRENLDVRVFFLSGFLFVFQPKRTRNDIQASNSEIKEIFMISFWKSLRM